MKHLKVTRHSVIVIACVALVFVAGVTANKAWNHHVSKVQAAEQHKKSEDAKLAQAHSAAVADTNKHIATECLKETGYYNLLSPVQKKTQAAPNCKGIVINE